MSNPIRYTQGDDLPGANGEVLHFVEELTPVTQSWWDKCLALLPGRYKPLATVREELNTKPLDTDVFSISTDELRKRIERWHEQHR